MTIRKTFQGAYEISDIIHGERIAIQYMGYTKKQAMSKFKEECMRKKLYVGITSDAFEEPFCIWNRITEDYFKDNNGDIPTFKRYKEAKEYLMELR